ncbi:F-box only protein 15-like [Tubulanus polymorphus]|uniref:F-box only protein 15-like n=1 Tax=Tubulanus polymorphus TaxID=672921 RepID=UPI003DA523C5
MATGGRHRTHLAGYMRNRREAKNNKPVHENANRETPSKKFQPKSRPVFKGKPCLSNLPDEILLQVFSALTPSDLLLAARVCRRWRDLTNDNLIWKPIFDEHIRKDKKKCIAQPLDPPPGYWKTECIKGGVANRNGFIGKYLKKKSPYTKLPADLNKALQLLGISWLLSFVDSDGNEHPVTCKDVYYFAMSVTVRWYDLQLPPVDRIRKLKIYSMNPVFVDKKGKASPNSPSQRSLLLERDFHWSRWCEDKTPLSEDEAIRVFDFGDGVAVSNWKGDGELAFITVSFHAHQLLDRCIQGNAYGCANLQTRKPKRQDLDGKYGFYGYSCIIEVRDQRNVLWNEQFLNLDNTNMSGDHVCLSPIDAMDNVYHQVLSKKLNFPWKTDLFKGIMQDMCIMDVTVLDKHELPIWTISSPVSIRQSAQNIDFEFEGDKRGIHYRDSKGYINLLIDCDRSTAKNTVVSLQLFIAMGTIDDWFGTNYQTKQTKK